MSKKYKIGYTCGVFDLLHVGHLNLLERCKAMCDKLIVGVCDDTYVREVKHKEPVIPAVDRVRMLKALKVVDDAQLVNIQETDDKVLVQKRFGFDVLFSGDDWKGSARYIKTEQEFASLVGGGGYLSNICPIPKESLLLKSRKGLPQNEVSEAKHDAPLKAVTFGVFDLLHFGHFELFRRCKDLIGRDGTLMVAVQLDEYVTKYKPQARLVYDWSVRANMIRALRYVDEVVPYSNIDESIRGFEFDLFVVGADQVHLGFQRAKKWCEEQGKRVVSLSRTEGISSSMLKSANK